MGGSASAMADSSTFLPVDDPGERAELIDLVKALRERGRDVAEQTALLVGPDGTRLPLPPALYKALARAADTLANGFAVTVAPQHMALSTHQAAEMLGMSRPTLVRLLEEGEIPYEKASDRPGAHRRVKLSDILDYKEHRRTNRRRLLRELTEDALEGGTYGKAADEL